MQIEAIYENGHLKFDKPIHFKKKKIKVTVFFPDEAVSSKHSAQSTIREEINTILGKYAHPRPAAGPTADKKSWHKHLEEKYSK